MKKFQTLRYLINVKNILLDRFNLEEDKANENEIIESIYKGVEFKGTNLWVLIFAIIIASVGLNVNSAAVIIGAMLISPLMAPIMGLGFGVAINDLELIKKAFKNLSVAVLFSVMTSTIYFLISPVGESQSELLARTTPTIWDVLIALFGGLAGIVATTRKQFSNVIPGVAIATALMPPLCTAGFGLASGNLSFFFGAFYLFFINSVFISLSTILIVRYLKFPKKEFYDSNIKKKVLRFIYLIVLVTVIPSTVITYNIINQMVFEKRINSFINDEFVFEKSKVISKNTNYDEKRIELYLIGEEINDEIIRYKTSRKHNYKLDDYNIVVNQGSGAKKNLDLNLIKTGLIEDLYKRNENIIKTKDEKILLLEKEIRNLSVVSYPIEDIYNEAKVINKNLLKFFITKSIVFDEIRKSQDTITVGYAKFKVKQSKDKIKSFDNWLKARVKTDKLKLFVE
ncbi:MAG: TIGR00341 family protein [Ignavibacteriales bacterium]|nr:TIGR00341 family protein [Ignavibacteriales bacterium]